MTGNDWERLANDPTYIGGVVRSRGDEGRRYCHRVSAISRASGTLNFRFDAVAVSDDGKLWHPLPLQDNDFMWLPIDLMRIAFAEDGTATVSSEIVPVYLEAVHPMTALPADTPRFASAGQA